MEKKVIKYIIIAIVAAVAMWLLWKKGLFSKLNATAKSLDFSDIKPVSGDSAIDIEYILSHVVLDSQERNAINKLAEKCKTDADTRQSIQAKAYKNGLSFDQQVACDAIWMLYHEYSNGVWSSGWTSDRGWTINSEIKKL